MIKSRRDFLASASLAGGMSTVLPLFSGCSNKDTKPKYLDYSKLDQALKLSVLKKELFPSPVIIEKLELLQDRDNFICRVRSNDGAEGISIGHPFISKAGYPMFKHCLQEIFLGKDARDLDVHMFKAVENNIKRQGIPLCVQIATIEFAVLDMLGNIVSKPIGHLIGEIHHPKISIYLGTRLSELRNEEPEVSLELVYKDWQETKAKAIKIRAGRGDNLGQNNENAPGRTEKLIKMAREKFDDDIVLMIDGNGTYDVKEAIRIGKILEEYNYYFYEEPVPWDWYQEQEMVKDALQIKMAGGEEEFGIHAFRWLSASNVFDIYQPDLFYFGGMVRTMQVSRMAGSVGKSVTPHMSGGGLGYLYMLHFTSVCPNADRYHEFKMFETHDANGTIIPFESKSEILTSINGDITVPTGPGLGITIDPEYIKTHKVLYE